MQRDEITERAAKVVQAQWAHYRGRGRDEACPAITRETDLFQDLQFDSLDMIELVMAFEEEFDLEVPDQEAEDLKTFGQAVEYLLGKLQVAA